MTYALLFAGTIYEGAVAFHVEHTEVVDLDPVLGYLHRGVEKLCEHRDWAQIVLITDRMDYVAAATNNLGYCETVEKLMSIEVPKRAHYIRTILAELQRIASHALWLGTHAMDIGAMTVFLACSAASYGYFMLANRDNQRTATAHP